MANFASAFWIIPQESPTKRVQFLSPLIKHLSPPDVKYPIVSRLVYTDQEMPPFNPAGAILVYQARSGQFHEDTVRKLKNSGIRALVVQMLSDTYYPGYGNIIRKKPFTRENPFPVYELTFQQSRDLKGWFENQTARGVIVSFDKEEPNPWQHHIDTVWPASGIVSIFTSGFVLIAAAYKLTLMIWVLGPQISIGQCVLSFVILAMLIRFIWNIVDPFGAYSIAAWAWTALGLSLSFPFVIGSTLLIALYWHEMITKTGKKVNIFLKRMLIPFLIFIFLLICFEFGTALSRGLRYYSLPLMYANAAVYVVVVIAVFIFFLVSKIRLSQLFGRVKSSHLRRRRRLGRANIIIAGITFVLIVFVAMLLMIATAKILWKPVAFTTIWLIILYGIDFLALLQVLLIRAPERPWRWILCGIFHPNPAELIPSVGSSSLRNSSSINRSKGTSVVLESKSGGSTSMRQWSDEASSSSSADDAEKLPGGRPALKIEVSSSNESEVDIPSDSGDSDSEESYSSSVQTGAGDSAV